MPVWSIFKQLVLEQLVLKLLVPNLYVTTEKNTV